VFQYLLELRKRLLFSIVVILVVFAILCFFSRDIYQLLALPLLARLPDGNALIAIGITSPFLVPFKLTFVVALAVCAPFWLYQLWGFVAPALYRQERKFVWLMLLVSTLLFYCGIAFAYFIVLPLVLGFFIHIAPTSVRVMPDIGHYLAFSLKLFFAFALAFEVPVLTLLLIKSGLTTRASLARKRPFIIVLAFVVGMILTPPDIISQVLLALPMWMLFELGLLLSVVFVKKSDELPKSNVIADTPDS